MKKGVSDPCSLCCVFIDIVETPYISDPKPTSSKRGLRCPYRKIKII